MQRALLFLMLVAGFWPGSALAQDLEGAWALKIGDAIIFRFEMERDADDQWTGSWTRPASFRTNGVFFSNMHGSETVQATSVISVGGKVELAFANRPSAAASGLFRFRQTGPDQAELTHVATGYAPYPLIRVAPGSPLGPFSENYVYDRDNAVSEPALAEMVDIAEIVPAPEAEPDLAPPEAERTESFELPPLAQEPLLPTDEAAEEPEDAPEEPARPRIGPDFLEGF